MDPHTVPSDVCLGLNVNGSKQRNGDLLYGMNVSLDII